MEHRNVTCRVFSSFEEEAEAEYLRRSEQSPEDWINEFAILQERCWGEKWTSQTIVPVFVRSTYAAIANRLRVFYRSMGITGNPGSQQIQNN